MRFGQTLLLSGQQLCGGNCLLPKRGGVRRDVLQSRIATLHRRQLLSDRGCLRRRF
jgi:hypothetical protein